MNPKSLVCSACIFLSFYCARGQSVTLTLDNVPETVQCNEVWTEQDVSLSFVTTTTDDCAPDGCYFAANGPADGFAESVMIWPSRLTVDLTGLQVLFPLSTYTQGNIIPTVFSLHPSVF